MPSDRSADRHLPGRQIGVSLRLDKDDFDALETHRTALGITRRQAIITAIREWTAKRANPLRDATEAGTANREITVELRGCTRETIQTTETTNGDQS